MSSKKPTWEKSWQRKHRHRGDEKEPIIDVQKEFEVSEINFGRPWVDWVVDLEAALNFPAAPIDPWSKANFRLMHSDNYSNENSEVLYDGLLRSKTHTEVVDKFMKNCGEISEGTRLLRNGNIRRGTGAWRLGNCGGPQSFPAPPIEAWRNINFRLMHSDNHREENSEAL